MLAEKTQETPGSRGILSCVWWGRLKLGVPTDEKRLSGPAVQRVTAKKTDHVYLKIKDGWEWSGRVGESLGS